MKKCFSYLSLVILALLVSANAHAGHKCFARSSGGSSCSGSYSGYDSQSKGLAIQDALTSCASQAGSQCVCSLDYCLESSSREFNGCTVSYELKRADGSGVWTITRAGWDRAATMREASFACEAAKRSPQDSCTFYMIYGCSN